MSQNARAQSGPRGGAPGSGDGRGPDGSALASGIGHPVLRGVFALSPAFLLVVRALCRSGSAPGALEVWLSWASARAVALGIELVCRVWRPRSRPSCRYLLARDWRAVRASLRIPRRASRRSVSRGYAPLVSPGCRFREVLEMGWFRNLGSDRPWAQGCVIAGAGAALAATSCFGFLITLDFNGSSTSLGEAFSMADRRRLRCLRPRRSGRCHLVHRRPGEERGEG